MSNRNELITQIMDFLPRYGYNGTDYEVSYYGVGRIIDTWFGNKANTPLFKALETHPNYNGRFQIVLDESFHRKIERREVLRFMDWLEKNLHFREDDTVLYGEDKEDIGFKYFYTENQTGKYVLYYGTGTTRIYTYANPEDCYRENGTQVVQKSYDVTYNFTEEPTQYITEEFRETLDKVFPWLKPHSGAKASKIFRRICKYYKLDQLPDFATRWPRFADAINPLEVKRWTIISWHPIDYFTMSFGNDWQSCHTIDKDGRRRVGGDHYNGCYSAGTMSYMLDPSSIVMYTVDKSYDGNEFEFEPKMSRQMFHLADGVFVQGRLYPQGNDVGAENTYREMRDIFQRVISEATGISNYWDVKKGTWACTDWIETDSNACHYRDYECFGNCTVSKAKNADIYPMIHVGHAAICPNCGESHWESDDNIMCEECRDVHYCDYCDDRITGGGIETYDGHFYCCEECAIGAGYVYCESGNWRSEDDEDVYYDRWNGCYYDDGMPVETEDGNTYYTHEHAELDGYREYDGLDGLYTEDQVRWCTHCESYVLEEDFDDDEGMCDRCVEHEREEVG